MNMNQDIKPSIESLSCPLPIDSSSRITLAHGGGGRMTQQLIEKIFRPAFNNPTLETRHDGAILNIPQHKLAFTADSYVVDPLFFPGGNIGSLSVNGTVNDLAMCGAKPLYLSASFILEEGLSMETLWNVVQSMKQAADQAGVYIVTGDTKVVDKGKGDGIFINTSGVGVIDHDLNIHPQNLQIGDKIILSGDIGRHGTAILSAREGMQFHSQIESDCAEVTTRIQKLIESGIEIHCLRDLTRGGLATALIEIAQTAQNNIQINESQIPVREDVQGACEILGLDPLYIANEGQFIAIVKANHAENALGILQKSENGIHAGIIGHVYEKRQGKALLKTKIGTSRVLDMLSGEQLPRIC